MKRIVISDESLNCYGFWILTSGIVLDAFNKNPVMLWNHNRDESGSVNAQLPIGYWKDLRVEDGKLTAEPVFDETDEFAVRIKKKYEAGVLNACSMGFRVIEWSEDPKMLKQGQTVATVTKCLLLEVSICDIPANANATVVLYDSDNKIINLSGLPGSAIGPKVNIKMPKEIALKLGLDENASPQDVMNAIQSKDEEIASLKSEKATLEAKVKSYEDFEAAARKQEAVTLLDEAVRSGRLDANSRPKFERLFELDHDSAKEALAALPERKALRVNNTEEKHEDRSGWTYLDWMKNDPEGLKKMKADEPERFKELQKTIQQKH